MRFATFAGPKILAWWSSTSNQFCIARYNRKRQLGNHLESWSVGMAKIQSTNRADLLGKNRVTSCVYPIKDFPGNSSVFKCRAILLVALEFMFGGNWTYSSIDEQPLAKDGLNHYPLLSWRVSPQAICIHSHEVSSMDTVHTKQVWRWCPPQQRVWRGRRPKGVPPHRQAGAQTQHRLLPGKYCLHTKCPFHSAGCHQGRSIAW